MKTSKSENVFYVKGYRKKELIAELNLAYEDKVQFSLKTYTG